MESVNQIVTQNLLSIGTLLKGNRYRIDKYIASGGFGNTYKVYDKDKNNICAIKEFFISGDNHREAGSNNVSISNPMKALLFENMKSKFKKEAQRLISLNNPHIVKVYDLFEENKTVYYVMIYIEGCSLYDMIKNQNRQFIEIECYNILNQLLNALEVIHSNGLIHMDIKPGNILIDNSGNCTLIDFGASKQTEMDGITNTSSAVCYTQGYAPPEQISGNKRQWSPWTDFYALGATLYCIITGKKTPTHDQLLTYGYDILKFPIGISRKLQDLIKWMMHLAFNKRPQNVKQIYDFLNTDDEKTLIGSNQKAIRNERIFKDIKIEDFFKKTYKNLNSFCNKMNIDFWKRFLIALAGTFGVMLFVLGILFCIFGKNNSDMAFIFIGIPIAIIIFIFIFKIEKEE